MTKTLLVAVFLTAAMPSAEACGDLQNIQKCASTMQGDIAKGTSTCDVFQSYLTCISSKLNGCPQSMRDSMEKQLKSTMSAQYKDLGNCQAEPSPAPGGSSPTPSSVPSPAETSSACATFDLTSKMSECQKPFMQTAASGDVCAGWKQLECCLLDSVASCGKSMQDQVKTALTTTSDTFKNNPMFANALGSCGAATCQSTPPAPVKVSKATTLMASIILEDPRTFDLDKFKAAVLKHSGASGVEGVLKAFEILVQYMMPEAMDLQKVKAAIAKANSVQENQIKFANGGSRRLSAQRLLAAKTMSINVTIAVPDAEQAKDVKDSAANVTKLASDLGEAVSLSQAPVATAKVETIVTSDDPSMTSSMLASKMENVGADVGGTVMVTEMPPLVQQSSSASSCFGGILAPVMFLLAFVLVM